MDWMRYFRMGLAVVVFGGAVVFAAPIRAHGMLPHVRAEQRLASPSAAPTPVPIEYALPYPGLLPTHPLYVIKELRDRIIELLISDPVSKGEFYVLQADKKLNMALALAGQGNSKEVGRALGDAQFSRGRAVGVLEAYRKAGHNVPGHVMERLMRSVRKHEEILVSLGENPEWIRSLKERIAALQGGE